MRTTGWLLGIVCAGVCSAAMVGVETFGSGLSGLEEGSISTEMVHSASGWNPDGQLLLRRVLANPGEMGGPTTTNAVFIGDYAAAGIGGITVDLYFGAANVTGAFFQLRPAVSRKGWRAPPTTVFTPAGDWSTYTLAFDPTWSDADAVLAGWSLEGGAPSVAALMSSVGWAEIRIVGPNTSTIVGVDNFGRTGVPEPSSVLMLGCGLGAFLAWKRRRSSPARFTNDRPPNATAVRRGKCARCPSPPCRSHAPERRLPLLTTEDRPAPWLRPRAPLPCARLSLPRSRGTPPAG